MKITSSGDSAIMPGFDEPLALEQRQMRLKLVAQCFISV
ncbi:Hypothetical protein CAP_4511 [Chondromyces apiculatus DSM 436]|uniref:Uncharacterized protein n=1 Tax=Chondromyces apiculatus DSM 436 TaxID=1192034 RepID=A0A017T5R6_9BACT|nr:Hypothetical protein CAP_4511 [Chondromyces apiculatus DSM 436]